jgi:hypothetical protein
LEVGIVIRLLLLLLWIIPTIVAIILLLLLVVIVIVVHGHIVAWLVIHLVGPLTTSVVKLRRELLEVFWLLLLIVVVNDWVES